MRRRVAMLLAAILSLSLAAPARAEDDLSTTTSSGSRASSVVELTAEAAPFSVTVRSGTVTSAMPTIPTMSFADVEPDAWYSEGVRYCAETGLVEGYDDGLYHPFDATTRGMIVQMLWRLERSPTVTTFSEFGDVSDEWYAPAVRWAASCGIVTGYGDGTFRANDVMLREQLVTILYRYAKYSNTIAESGKSEPIVGFADVAEISAYAQAAMAWAVESGIVTGTSSTTISPLDSATRAEIATIMARYAKEVAAK